MRTVIAAYPGDALLLVADATEKYGSNWYLCTTEEAKAREMELLGAAERAAAEEARKAREEEERKAAEEHRLATLVVHEQPLVARPYKSASAEESAEDVRDLSVRRSRPLLALRLQVRRRADRAPPWLPPPFFPLLPSLPPQRRRYAFGAKCSFNDRDYDAPIADFRPRREPNYELKRLELSVSLQVGRNLSLACCPALALLLPLPRAGGPQRAQRAHGPGVADDVVRPPQHGRPGAGAYGGGALVRSTAAPPPCPPAVRRCTRRSVSGQ